MRQPLSRFFNVFSELTIFIAIALGKGRKIGSHRRGVKPRRNRGLILRSVESRGAILSARRRRGKILAAAPRFGHVVTTREESLDVACGLAKALPILDQSDTDKPLAIFAKADAWRYRHVGLFEQQL